MRDELTQVERQPGEAGRGECLDRRMRFALPTAESRRVFGLLVAKGNQNRAASPFGGKRDWGPIASSKSIHECYADKERKDRANSSACR